MATATDRITKAPEICGGDACIRGHRIPVWLLVGYRRLGLSDARILEAFPSLELADLEAAWDYADTHQDEIDQTIHENEAGDAGLVE